MGKFVTAIVLLGLEDLTPTELDTLEMWTECLATLLPTFLVLKHNW